MICSVFTICFAVYMIYDTYKQPASLMSTNLKGYLGGGLMFILGAMSIAGKFSLLGTVIGLIRKTIHLKANQSGIGILIFICIIFLIVALTYFRPDKIKTKYNYIPAKDTYAKTKLVCNCLFFYFAWAISIAYLLVWVYKTY